MAPAFRAGFVTLLGRPNVGKSTLLNQLLSFKLSIVSPKPQTTRHVIRGVVHGEGYQVVFLDTPGLMRRPMHQLDLRMLQSLQFAAGEADLLLLVVEPKMPGDIEARFMEELRQQEKPVFLVVNKVDTVAKPHLLPVLEEYEKRYPFQELVPISALMGDGVALLLDLVVRRLPEGEALYPPDELTDRSERFLAGEIIREKVYRLYKEEVPHATTVAIETFVEQSSEHGGKDYISAIIYVERDTQRRILIGRGGLALKQVGVEARKDIEEMLGRPVHLEMWVKSASRWRQNPVFLQEMGY
ncbi:MAG: GTPase Era [Dehalococcoidia bacterium]|nr:GTPase Era [Dehalococcoidia bacterium]